MIRVIVQIIDVACSVNVGGPVETRVKTFDIEIPEIEEYLRKVDKQNYTNWLITGFELLDKPKEGGSHANGKETV